MSARFVAVGEVMLDLGVETIAPGRAVHVPMHARVGGSPVTAAIWASAAGAASAVVGRVGADAAGRMIRAELYSAGIEARLAEDADRPTGLFLQTSVDGTWAIAANRGANVGLSPNDLGELDADAVLVSGYVLLHDDVAAVAREALSRARARWLAVDVGSASLVTRVGPAGVLERAARANVLLANEEEALALTGHEPETAATELAREFELVCIKLGGQGVIAASGGKLERCGPAERVASPAPGAGDAFAGALLAALAGGGSPAAALTEACAAGARAAAGLGP